MTKVTADVNPPIWTSPGGRCLILINPIRFIDIGAKDCEHEVATVQIGDPRGAPGGGRPRGLQLLGIDSGRRHHRRHRAGSHPGHPAQDGAGRHPAAGRRPARLPEDDPEARGRGQGLPVRRAVLGVHRRSADAPGVPGRGDRHRLRRQHSADLRPGPGPGPPRRRRVGERGRLLRSGHRPRCHRHQGLGGPAGQAGRLPAGHRGRGGAAPGARQGRRRPRRRHHRRRPPDPAERGACRAAPPTPASRSSR